MPTYDFRCPNGHEFEQFFPKISDAQSELPCPTCGLPAERLISGGAGLLFKGSGFYLTDYGRNAHRRSGDAPKGDGGSKGGGEGGSSGGSSSGGSASSGGSGSSGAE